MNELDPATAAMMEHGAALASLLAAKTDDERAAILAAYWEGRKS